jgi:hypothetical protein
MSQTGITNRDTIIQSYTSNQKDMMKTIFHLMNIQEEEPVKFQEKSAIEQLRDIVNEKEQIFHRVMADAKANHQPTESSTVEEIVDDE